MADLPGTARVAIIGWDDAGASCLHHLARAGWTDCLPLEKNELNADLTWHAAGWSVMDMQRCSTERNRGLAAAVDNPTNCHMAGSIRRAHSGS